MLGWFCQRFLEFFRIFPVRVYGRENYQKAKNGSEYTVLVFNHVLFTDIPLLLRHVDHVAFVGYGKYLQMPLLAPFAQMLRCIPVPSIHPRRSVTDLIQEHIITRRPGEPLLAIAPDQAKPATEESGPIAFFRSGAFVSRCKVVPVVIRYFPEMPAWPEGKTMQEMMKERRDGGPLSVTISIMEPMTVHSGEDVATFRERVRSSMTQEFLQLRPPTSS